MENHKVIKSQDNTALLLKRYMVSNLIYREMIADIPRGELLQRICSVLSENYDFPLVWIGLISNSRHPEMIPAAFAGSSVKYLTEIVNCVSYPENEVLDTHTSYSCEDIGKSHFDKEWKQIFSANKFKSFLILPFLKKSTLKGLLCLYSDKKDIFSSNETDFFGQIAEDTCSIISRGKKHLERIIQTDLLSWARIQKKEKIIELQKEKEIILNNFGKEIVQSLSIDDIINSAINSIIQAVYPDLVLFFLRKENNLILHRSISPDSTIIFSEKQGHRVGECLCGSAVIIKEAIYSININNDTRRTRDDCVLAGVQSFASIPLIVKEKVLGVIGIASTSYKNFKTNNAFLETLSGQLAIGLENALLFADVKQKAVDLGKELKEKNVLLKEIHHRVKNNLNVIASLLNLQLNEVENGKDATSAFTESRNRIFAMSQVHEKLYETEDFSEIEMAPYIKSVTEELISSYSIGKSISVQTDIETIFLSINTAIPFGLILNEVITNSLKYAFPDTETGRIFISLKRNQNLIIFTIKDNGIGLPPSMNPKEHDSLGLTLINLLADQLDGTLSISGSSGTEISIQFPANPDI